MKQKIKVVGRTDVAKEMSAIIQKNGNYIEFRETVFGGSVAEYFTLKKARGSLWTMFREMKLKYGDAVKYDAYEKSVRHEEALAQIVNY